MDKNLLATTDEIRTWLKTVDLTELDNELTQVGTQVVHLNLI
jgi:hypothetical protein